MSEKLWAGTGAGSSKHPWILIRCSTENIFFIIFTSNPSIVKTVYEKIYVLHTKMHA